MNANRVANKYMPWQLCNQITRMHCIVQEYHRKKMHEHLISI